MNQLPNTDSKAWCKEPPPPSETMQRFTRRLLEVKMEMAAQKALNQENQGKPVPIMRLPDKILRFKNRDQLPKSNSEDSLMSETFPRPSPFWCCSDIEE